MDLKIVHDIDSNVFSTKITIDSFGTEQLSYAEEKELLGNFKPKIRFKTLVFNKNVKMDGKVVTVCGDGEGVSVTLPALSNREIELSENFTAEYKIETDRVSPSAIDATVLTTTQLVAQAYCVVFDEVIREAVEEKMNEIRGFAPAFEGENIVSV